MSFNPQTHYQNKSVATNYDRERFASVAGQAFQRAELKSLEQIVQPLPSRGTLLDVPCGTGRIAEALLKWGFQVTAADISGEMIDVARQRITSAGGRLPALRASADSLPFPDSSFDAVISMRFLPHISHEPRRLMLREMARVSKRWVIFSNSFSSGWYRSRRMVKRYLGHQAPTRFPVTEDELMEDLRFANLKENTRLWTFRFVSEEILMLCEKKG
jgi:ubiquinone/menaquinone biosynthesis C-methylase UbiE